MLCVGLNNDSKKKNMKSKAGKEKHTQGNFISEERKKKTRKTNKNK